MQWASSEAIESSIAHLINSKADPGTPSGSRSDHGGDLESSSVMLPATAGPLQMTNQQVELAQEIAAYLKASHSNEGQKVRWLHVLAPMLCWACGTVDLHCELSVLHFRAAHAQ